MTTPDFPSASAGIPPSSEGATAAPSTMGGEDRQVNYSFTGLIAPVLAGFSLPAIIVFASNSYPGPPSHDIILSLLVAATGFFMASIQLTSPLADKRFRHVGAGRAAFTMLGICLIALAIILLGAPAMHRWYGILALIVIFIGGFGPAILLVVLWFQDDRPPGGATD
jgi:hypothetical protein